MQKITSVKSSRQLLKVSTVEPHSAAGLFLLVWCVSGTKQYEIGKELFSIFLPIAIIVYFCSMQVFSMKI